MKRILFLICMLVALPAMSQEAGPRLSRARVMPPVSKTHAVVNAKALAQRTVGLMNRLSRDTIGADVLHGLNVTGKGVVLCIVDTGIDFNHKAFTDSTGTSHVKVAMIYPEVENDTLWNETHTDWRWNYKIAQTAEEISGLTTDSKTQDHGSHTSASAGGARRKVGKENSEFYGMAPDADLFLVGNPRLSDEYTLDAFYHAKEYARSVGKPLVCSYSIGTPFMPLDTLEYWPQALKRFTDDGNAKGIAVCVSAGNSGSAGDKLSLHWDFSDNDAPLVRKTVIGHPEIEGKVVDYTNCYSMFYDVTNRDFEYQVSVMDATKDTVVWQSDWFSTRQELMFDLTEGTPLAKYGSVYISGGEDPDNHFKCAYVQATDFKLPYKPAPNQFVSDSCYVMTVTVAGERGGYIEGKGYPNSQYGVGFYSGTSMMSGYDDGDALSALNFYCVNPWCISVGSSNAVTPNGGFAYFSGYGYDYYGNPYPEVLAPGVNIISAYNRYHTNPSCLTVHPFRSMSGTSMSTPITAGLIACWMQEYPELTTRQIHEVFTKTSYIDLSLATTVPDPSKYGKGTIQGKPGWDYVRELQHPSALTEAVARLQSSAEAYNLQGIKVNNANGIVIKDNRKVFIGKQ